MRAWTLKKQAPIEEMPLTLEEITTPDPADHEIRIKVYACGICRTDIHIAEGDLPLRKTPVILGHEIVGVVDKVGITVKSFQPGDRAGVAWLNHACGTCKFCLSGKENLCPNAAFTGWDADGGYAEYTTLDEGFAFHLQEHVSFEELAPLMCPGIAGYRALKLADVKRDEIVGFYGFGPTAAATLQVAKHLGIRIFVITRSQKNRDAAKELGADWIGTYEDTPPSLMDAGIIFPPAGNLVEFALSQLDSDGRLVLAPVYMTPIEISDYNLLWYERSIKSLAHISRDDGREFLEIAAKINITTQIETFPFDALAHVLPLVKHGKIKGNAVIKIL